MTERLLDRRPGKPLTDYAQRMLDLMQVAKSMVEHELGGGIDFDVAMAIPHYPSDNGLIAAAMELVRQHERGER